MKRISAIILSVLLIAAVFAACSGKNNEDASDNPRNVASSNAWLETTITTDNAKIKLGDAERLIKAYSAKELSISKEDYKDCSFVVSGTGVKIENDYYVEVDAVIKHEKGKDENGKSVFSFDTKGKYFIRYDGKQVLKKDMEKEDKYTELELKEAPSEEETTK